MHLVTNGFWLEALNDFLANDFFQKLLNIFKSADENFWPLQLQQPTLFPAIFSHDAVCKFQTMKHACSKRKTRSNFKRFVVNMQHLWEVENGSQYWTRQPGIARKVNNFRSLTKLMQMASSWVSVSLFSPLSRAKIMNLNKNKALEKREKANFF